MTEVNVAQLDKFRQSLGYSRTKSAEKNPLTPTLSPLGRGRPLDGSALADPLGRGDHQPLLPAGEKVPEGRMRGSDGQFFSGL
jgi:hypothetical protein